jgi:hypothetical protein
MTSHNERILQLGAGKIEMNPPPPGYVLCSLLIRMSALHICLQLYFCPSSHEISSPVLQYSAAVCKGNFSHVFVLLFLRPCSSTFVGCLGYWPIEESEQEIFHFSTSSRQYSGTQPTSYPVGNEHSFVGGKATGT